MTALRLAYWPGCVSRGFTPELHGSMAQVAERLGIELVPSTAPTAVAPG